MHFVAARFQPIEEALGAIPLRFPGGIATFPIRVAIYDPSSFMLVQILPRDIESHSLATRVTLHVLLAFFVAGGLPRANGAFPERFAYVGNNQGVIHAHDPTEPAALFACPLRGVERKGTGKRSAVLDIATGTVQTTAVAKRGSFVTFVVNHEYRDVAVSLFK